jgi:hypothetical protein
MIKIEVTGNSILELADKLLAIGASLQGTTPNVFPRGATKAEAEGNVPKSAPVAEVTESQPTTEGPSSTPAPAASGSELSFETDVTPVVLAVVQTRGKPVVEEILAQFGVARASQLDPARWPELVAALQDKL